MCVCVCAYHVVFLYKMKWEIKENTYICPVPFFGHRSASTCI